MKHTPAVRWLAAALLLAGALWLVAAWRGIPGDWSAWRPATCMPDGCFCEALRAGALRQPSNSLSSLAYVLVGLLVAGTVGRWPRVRHAPWLGYTFAASAIAIGLGSAFYHASLSAWGQFLDVASMYLAVTFMLLYAWGRLYGLPARRLVLPYLALNSALDALLIAVPETRRWLFALVLLAALAVEARYWRRVRHAIEGKWLGAALALFAVAYALWVVDNQRWLCWPQSWLQGHALWHLGGAAALWLTARYYRSEAA